MEPRVNYALVGLFVILLAGTFVVGALWLIGVGPGGDTRWFAIYPPESVAGIARESLVRYQGVDVGKVREVGIDPRDPQRVRLLIEVRRDLPIQVDTTARIATQGLTGLVYFIELQGGTPGSPPLEAAPGAPYPVIRAVPSDLADLQRTGTALLEEARGAAVELRTTLATLRGLLGTEQDGPLGKAVGDAGQTAAHLAQAARTLQTQVERLGPLLDDLSKAAAGLPGLTHRAGETLESVVTAARAVDAAAGVVGRAWNRLDDLTAHTAPGLTAFSRDGVPELVGLLRDLRGVTARLDHLAADLERDPNLLISGRPHRPGPGER